MASRLVRALLAIALLMSPTAASASDVTVEFSLRLRQLAGEADAGEEAAETLANSRGAVEGYLAVAAGGELVVGEGGDLRAPNLDERRLLAACGARLGTREVEAHLRGRLQTAEPGEAWRAAALELMREHARADSVELLEQLVPEPRSVPNPRPHRELFRAALLAALRRDPDGLRALDEHLFGREDVNAEAVRAVAALGGPEAVTWITRRLERDGLTDVALQELARLGPSLAPPVAREAAEAVRPWIDSLEAGRRSQVLRTLAALRDEEAVPAMIAALESSEGVERRRVLAALRELSGLRMPDSAGAWLDWYERERAWWRDEGPSALARLRSAEDGEVVAAVSALSGRSLRRGFAALRLVDLLADHPSSSVRSFVCAGLSRLGSPAALPGLVDALEDSDAGVRAAALQALRSMTPHDLPAERAAWERALAAG